MKRLLPPRVFEKCGSYYHVRAVGDKRIWTKLSRVKQGLPTMYLALARLAAADLVDDRMPTLISNWMIEVASAHSKKTLADDVFRSRNISEAFAEYRARQVTAPVVVEFLKQFKGMPRTYNAYRSAVREFMRFAEEKGFRDAGTNPVDAIKTMKVRPRDRYITDSELRRIKVAALYGEDGLRTRSGYTLCCLIDMAYLTGQRIGDLLRMEWSMLGRDGILFEPAKTRESTGVRVLIEWTPKLRAVIERLKNPKAPPVTGKSKRTTRKPTHMRFVFSTQEGQPYKYSGASSAWMRAVKRAGVKNAHFHDLRAKALTDKDGREGMGAARTMGGHSTEQQTSDYVRHKTAKKTSATR